MFELMLQKILHKKWMIISLLIGNILLVAIAACNPMYRDAALTNMLQSEFHNYIESKNSNPAMLDVVADYRKSDKDHSRYSEMEALSSSLDTSLGIKPTSKLTHHSLTINTAVSALERADQSGDFKVQLGSLVDLPAHAKVVSGQMYHDTLDDQGRIEAVVTMTGFVEMNVLIGEEYEFPYLKDSDGNPFRVVIVGVITSLEDAQDYWVIKPESLTSEFLISDVLFQEQIIERADKFDYDTHWMTTFDYTKLRYSDVGTLYSHTNDLLEEGKGSSHLEKPAYMGLLTSYLDKEQRISITLTILMIPVLVLLCAFLYMISRQLFDMEESEISLFKSRGASRGQIMKLYFMQSGFLALIGVALGLPLAILITKAIGSASAFLEFVSRRPLHVAFTWELVLYTLGAVVVSMLMTILPAIRQSRISIVKQKQGRARVKKPFWEKFFLDIILIGVSLYGYYNFYRTQNTLTASVMSGSSLDPLLFVSSSLFILGCSLLCLRIIPLIARLVYAISHRHISPSGYAAFLEIIRTGRKKYFIMTFLMLTVALGIFNTTVARTIETNSDKNNAYLIGADVRVQETWKSNIWSVRMDPSIPLVYTEPDYGKYGSIPNVESMAQVYVDTGASFGTGREVTKLTVYGISTRDFGLTTADSMPDGLLEKHYFEYLNEMALSTDYVLASSNFRDKLGYQLGDSITYTTDEENITGIIVDFVDYFPGYKPQSTTLQPDGSTHTSEKYLVVGHLSTIQKATGIIPYQVWLNFAGHNTDAFYEFVSDYNVPITSIKDLGDTAIETRRDPLYEGTNGILTMSFIVVLILCLVGYLIYWILSIRSRELLFGIFRAMGMSRREIIGMLIREQIFASVLPIGCGVGIGLGSSILFVPMIQIAYASTSQVLPLELTTQATDLVRLFIVIGIMLIVGLIVLVRQILHMKLNEALKLGED